MYIPIALEHSSYSQLLYSRVFSSPHSPPAFRDLDSKVSKRELAAVNDWLSSGKPYHVMRDNKYHGTSILGGMFGMRLDRDNRAAMRGVFGAMVKASNGRDAGTAWAQPQLEGSRTEASCFYFSQ